MKINDSKWEKMASARDRLREEAEEEKTFIEGLGFCSFGIGSNPQPLTLGTAEDE